MLTELQQAAKDKLLSQIGDVGSLTSAIKTKATSTATSLVGDAVSSLSNAKDMASSVLDSMPKFTDFELPSMPDLPSFPEIPSIDDLTNMLPSIDSLTDMFSSLGIPSMPDFSIFPKLPSIPELPKTFYVSFNEKPDIPIDFI